MSTAVLIGHSYVRRLRELHAAYPEIKNGPPELDWFFVARGGLKVNRRADSGHSIFDYVHRAIVQRPKIIYIHCGENDLQDIEPRQIFENIRELVDRLVAGCRPKRIIISQLFLFPNNQELNGNAEEVNELLEEFWDHERNQPPWPTKVIFWRHTLGTRGPEAWTHFQDGVHLNRRTLVKYSKSVGTTLARNYNAIRREH